MIPQISQAPGVVQLVLNFLQELEQQGFTGDTATSYADRLTMSTDNSIYQLLPDAVVFPRSTADVALIARLAAQERYSSLIFTPRGGGTGTNGQALNQGIIVDMSRHMNRIIEINPEEGWVRVEAGVIKDQLNQYLKPFGYFFAPELSTSNRATLGGMINTDASGQGSLVYGKTSDHVLGVRAVLLGGDILDTQPLPVELAETLGKSNTTIGRIYNTVYQRCRQQRQLIIDNFPKLNRFLTGYDLRHVFNDEMTEFDLTRILTGSEGTLAFITEARLDITPLPKVRRLVNVKYDSFDSALRNAPFMVEARALSVETVDSKVLNLAREDIVWHSVSELITDVPDKEMLGLNIVEFAGDDEALIDERVNALCVRLDELIASQQAGVIGWQVCREIREISSKPIIMLTAKGEVFDKVLGLELGADDFLAKPVDMKELSARIKAVLRRCQTNDAHAENETVRFDNLEISLQKYELKVAGKVIDIPPKELELLYFLASNYNRVFTRDQLLDKVWGFDYLGDSRTVDVHVKRLREKLEGVSDKWNLKTVWGVGYKFELLT